MNLRMTSDADRPRRVGRWLRLALRLTRDDERGVSIVLLVASIVALFGMAALTIDVGILLQERRHLQNAADAAALAGARELPGNHSLAEAAATAFLIENGYDPADPKVTVTLVPAYNGDPDVFSVTVNHEISLAFAPVIGTLIGNPGATGAAKVLTSYSDSYAIFAIASACPTSAGLNIAGSSAVINGTVHSNGDANLSGGSNAIDPAITYACDYAQNGAGHTIANGTRKTGTRDTPVSYAYGDFAPCRFDYPGPATVNLKAKNEVWADPAKTRLLPGVYCFGGNVSVIGDGIVTISETGGIGVTFVARGTISFSGSDANLKPFRDGVLFYAESSSANAISLSGANGTYEGLIYAPNGGINFNDQNATVSGSLIGQTVSVASSGVTVTPDGSANGVNSNPTVALVE